MMRADFRPGLFREVDEMEENEMIEKKVYDAEDIQKLLGIGRSRTYSFLEEVYEKKEPFRVLKIGKMYRVPIDSFDRWMLGEK